VDVTEGWSLMQGATANGVDGIVASAAAPAPAPPATATWTKPAWPTCRRRAKVKLDMLANVAAERRPNSRLSLPDQGHCRA
jgi:2Fe-2S ferredoxin